MANSEPIILFVYYICIVTIHAQNPIGFRAFASPLRPILGMAAQIRYLQIIIDEGQYDINMNKNYQLFVPEGEFMPRQIWIGENEYNFNDTDWLLGATPNTTGWAQQNYYQTRGHSLIWAYDTRIPTWLLEQEASITPDKAKSLLSDYIHTVVGRYRGKVESWIVINEAISDYNETRPFNLRNSFWYRKLGEDFILYAFRFAQEADPLANLLYNEYDIESGGLKAERTLTFLSWLQSQGIQIHGMGMQWHINTSEFITPNDAHYQIAQRFIDLNISLIISELDVGIPMNAGQPIDPNALEKQAVIYRSLLQYALYFFPKIPAMITWGYTDRFSWIPKAKNYTLGLGLPLDCQYQPKPAYWQLQEELGRVVTDGIYRLSPQSQLDKCLGTSTNGTNSTLQLYSGDCNNANEKWNVTWLGDGTYRFSPQSATNSALNTYNATAPVGEVVTSNWTGDFNQEWAISLQVNNTFHIEPRNAYWRGLAVDQASNIVIVNTNMDASQQWILTAV
jgi:endo-1,4-beta-xylanase